VSADMRPEPGREPPPGCHFEARPESTLRWRLATQPKPCRSAAGRTSCARPSVAELIRGAVRLQWWAYCERHLYGRWIEDGRIMTWIAVEDVTR
jgi:hypothetical protein